MENKTRKLFSPVSLFVLFFSFLAIWVAVFAPSQKDFKVSYLDVGQGDSAYITLPDGKNVLIDGGPDKKVLDELGKAMPFYKRKIDIVFLSHPHADHVAGLVHVLNRYQVGRVVISEAIHNTPEYEEFLRLIKEKNIPATESVYGTEFDFSGGVKARILFTEAGAENLNDTSSVVLFSYKNKNFLFTGDLEKDYSQKMLQINKDLRADIIKVPHHGSCDAFNVDLYKNTQAKHAVVPVGENKYGHPCPELISFFEKSGIKYYRTDSDKGVVVALVKDDLVFNEKRAFLFFDF